MITATITMLESLRDRVSGTLDEQCFDRACERMLVERLEAEDNDSLDEWHESLREEAVDLVVSLTGVGQERAEADLPEYLSARNPEAPDRALEGIVCQLRYAVAADKGDIFHEHIEDF